MTLRLAGRMMIAFVAVLVVICIVSMILLRALMIDIGAVIVYFLGEAVAKGSRRAAKWSLLFMLLYAAMAVLVVVGIEIAPERLRSGSKPVDAAYLPWIQAGFAVLGLWAAVCVGLLIRGLWQIRTAPISPRI
jgi:hypothetical protein